MQIEEQPRERLPPILSDVKHGIRFGLDLPLPHNLIAVPSVKQRTNFSCGNAATLALLRYWSWAGFERVEESALYEPLETTRARGTEPQPIAAFLRNVAGLTAEYRYGDTTVADLERAVDACQPPIVDLQAWRDEVAPWPQVWDAGHYVVLVGYDHENLFVMDPSIMTPGPYAFLPRIELEERWHDLAGDEDEQVRRMAIFVRGSTIPRPADGPLPEGATRLE